MNRDGRGYKSYWGDKYDQNLFNVKIVFNNKI